MVYICVLVFWINTKHYTMNKDKKPTKEAILKVKKDKAALIEDKSLITK